MKKFGAPRFMSFKGVPKKCFGFTAKVLEGPIPGGGGGGRCPSLAWNEGTPNTFRTENGDRYSRIAAVLGQRR